MDVDFICAYCSEPNTVFVDPDGGLSQRYVEDCQICCRPNILAIAWDDALDGFAVDSMPENPIWQ